LATGEAGVEPVPLALGDLAAGEIGDVGVFCTPVLVDAVPDIVRVSELV
jgi:hypothetical protein